MQPFLLVLHQGRIMDTPTIAFLHYNFASALANYPLDNSIVTENTYAILL